MEKVCRRTSLNWRPRDDAALRDMKAWVVRIATKAARASSERRGPTCLRITCFRMTLRVGMDSVDRHSWRGSPRPFLVLPMVLPMAASQMVQADMVKTLLEVRKTVVIGFVGGSDLSKQKEQLGENGACVAPLPLPTLSQCIGPAGTCTLPPHSCLRMLRAHPAVLDLFDFAFAENGLTAYRKGKVLSTQVCAPCHFNRPNPKPKPNTGAPKTSRASSGGSARKSTNGWSTTCSSTWPTSRSRRSGPSSAPRVHLRRDRGA